MRITRDSIGRGLDVAHVRVAGLDSGVGTAMEIVSQLASWTRPSWGRSALRGPVRARRCWGRPNVRFALQQAIYGPFADVVANDLEAGLRELH